MLVRKTGHVWLFHPMVNINLLVFRVDLFIIQPIMGIPGIHVVYLVIIGIT